MSSVKNSQLWFFLFFFNIYIYIFFFFFFLFAVVVVFLQIDPNKIPQVHFLMRNKKKSQDYHSILKTPYTRLCFQKFQISNVTPSYTYFN